VILFFPQDEFKIFALSRLPATREFNHAENNHSHRPHYHGGGPALAMAGENTSWAAAGRYLHQQASLQNLHPHHQHDRHQHHSVDFDLARSHISQVTPMIVATNQPYFCPFPGFFYKLGMCDVFVILDQVQFPRGTTWITRNRFKNDQGTLWISIPVWKKGLGLQAIDEVRICHEGRWRKKHLESLRSAYAHAPYFLDHFELLKKVFSMEHSTILEFNLILIKYLREFLKIKTEIVLMSQLKVESRGNQLLIDICKALGGNRLLAQSAAGKYLDEDFFSAAGVKIQYMRYPSVIYPQLWGDFIPNLSAFDLVFNCGPKAREIIFA
jgi:hypothetical protein